MFDRYQSFSTQNLSVGYRHGQVENVLFESLNLSLPEGKLTCFMGPNGIGKSTLIRTISGLQPPLEGKLSPLNEKSFAIVLTDKISATNMSVYDLVSYGRYPHLGWGVTFTEEDHEQVRQALEEVGIRAISAKRLEELSDGQLQLAMVARALAQNTPVLLLDEPTAHLDLNNRVEIMTLLLELTRTKNKSILVATHELDLALQMADYIWLATRNNKIKTGTPEDLVLDGSFDDVFQFKGFDLKTGKVQHKPFRNETIHLQGKGHRYLWTKNALEREGFSVSNEGAVLVKISDSEWHTNNNTFSSVDRLVQKLKQKES
ncbi:MAG: ABC transporter ATP-binding protein [Bacteroidetes bacterium]|nr:ABC transporter ATP-binding protein [Bacteroidota bacterium]